MYVDFLENIDDSELWKNSYLRHQICFSSLIEDKGGNILGYSFRYNGTLYKITKDFRIAVLLLHQANKNLILSKYRNSLILVGMGNSYEAQYDDDICNHRVYCKFVNAVGRLCSFELVKGVGSDRLIFSSAYISDTITFKESNLKPFKIDTELNRTKSNLLQVVNEHFNCCFEKVFLDTFALHISDAKIFCYSQAHPDAQVEIVPVMQNEIVPIDCVCGGIFEMDFSKDGSISTCSNCDRKKEVKIKEFS